MEEKDIGFGMVDALKDAKVAKKLGKLACVFFVYDIRKEFDDFLSCRLGGGGKRVCF